MADSDTGTEDLQRAFERIEAQVDQGNTDLREFWALVRRVKADPMLSQHWAEEVGRIDHKAFERRVRPTFPVWLGNALLMSGTLVLLWVAFLSGFATAGWFSDSGATSGDRTLGGIMLLVSAVGLSVTVHDPAHWVIGRLSGIRFKRYFLDGPTRIQPGLKSDYASYLRTPPGARAAMHAAGAIASKLAPFLALFLGGIAIEFDLGTFPWWAVVGVIGFGALQLLTDLLFSVKQGDWKKVRRELLVARAQETRKG